MIDSQTRFITKTELQRQLEAVESLQALIGVGVFYQSVHSAKRLIEAQENARETLAEPLQQLRLVSYALSNLKKIHDEGVIDDLSIRTSKHYIEYIADHNREARRHPAAMTLFTEEQIYFMDALNHGAPKITDPQQLQEFGYYQRALRTTNPSDDYDPRLQALLDEDARQCRLIDETTTFVERYERDVASIRNRNRDDINTFNQLYPDDTAWDMKSADMQTRAQEHLAQLESLQDQALEKLRTFQASCRSPKQVLEDLQASQEKNAQIGEPVERCQSSALATLSTPERTAPLTAEQQTPAEFRKNLELEVQQIIESNNFSYFLSTYDAAFHQDNRHAPFADIRAQVMTDAFNRMFQVTANSEKANS